MATKKLLTWLKSFWESLGTIENFFESVEIEIEVLPDVRFLFLFLQIPTSQAASLGQCDKMALKKSPKAKPKEAQN